MATTILTLGVILPMAAMGIHQIISNKKSVERNSRVENVQLTNIPNDKPPIKQPVPESQDTAQMYTKPANCVQSFYNRENRSQLHRHIQSNPVPITTHFVSEKAELDCCENRYADRPMRSSSLYVNGPKVDMPNPMNCQHSEIELKGHHYNPSSFVKLKNREHFECVPEGKKSVRLNHQFTSIKPNNFEVMGERKIKSVKTNHRPGTAKFENPSVNNTPSREVKPRVFRSNIISRGPSKEPYRNHDRTRDWIERQDEKRQLTKKPKIKARTILGVSNIKKRKELNDDTSDPKYTFINKYNSKRQKLNNTEIRYMRPNELKSDVRRGRNL